jgi:hypothetical protein
MGKVEEYRQVLRQTAGWEGFLLRESRLPGPRANIELAQAVVEEGDADLFSHLLVFNSELAPANTPQEFLAFCGALGQGKLLEGGQLDALQTLRSCANDTRWRIREAVALALQRYGRFDMRSLLDHMLEWSGGTLLERRAAAAGLCEPGLLVDVENCREVFSILEAITASILKEDDRRSDSFLALRRCLGYCWSVAVAAQPEIGKLKMEEWFAVEDKDVRWLMRQNLKKRRLERADPDWTTTSLKVFQKT